MIEQCESRSRVQLLVADRKAAAQSEEKGADRKGDHLDSWGEAHEALAGFFAAHAKLPVELEEPLQSWCHMIESGEVVVQLRLDLLPSR